VTPTIRVGLVTDGFFNVPFYAGVDHGLFASAGLTVENVVLDGIDKVTSALLDGDIQVGVGSPEHVLHDVERGGPLRMVAGNINRLTHSLIVRPDITRLEDLRGEIIGVSALSAGTSSLFRSILDDVGLSYPEDYTIVEAGAVPPRHHKLVSGEIAAAMQTDPHNYIAEDAGFGNLGAVMDLIPYFQFTSVNVDHRWASANESALTTFLEVALKASQWMYEDRAGAVAVAQQHMDIETRYLERAWQDHVTTEAVPRDMRLLEPSIQTALDLMRRYRSSETVVDADATPSKYVEGGYLERAQRNIGVPLAVLV